MTIPPLRRIRAARLALVDGPHPLEAGQGEAVERSWQRRHRDNPALFDGRCALGARYRIDGDTLHADMHAARYASLLHLLHAPEAIEPSWRHVFAWPVITGSDGRVLMGRMGSHTASPGLWCCPAGSLEPQDFPDGWADLEGNMAREVREETGLDLRDGRPRDGLLVAETPRWTALLQIWRFDCPTDALAERARAFIASEAESELADVACVVPGTLMRDMVLTARALMRGSEQWAGDAAD